MYIYIYIYIYIYLESCNLSTFKHQKSFLVKPLYCKKFYSQNPTLKSNVKRTFVDAVIIINQFINVLLCVLLMRTHQAVRI